MVAGTHRWLSAGCGPMSLRAAVAGNCPSRIGDHGPKARMGGCITAGASERQIAARFNHYGERWLRICSSASLEVATCSYGDQYTVCS